MKALVTITVLTLALLSGCATIERDVLPTYSGVVDIINIIKVIPK